MRRLALLPFLLLGVAAAQPVTLSGEIRHRSELDDRDAGAVEAATPVHLLRTRLAADARPAPHVRAFVQVQDARRWGEERTTLDGDADQLDLHQAFFELDSLAGRPVAIRVGRQELSYGNQRLVGAVGWSNVGRSFDAARLRWTGPATVDVFAAQLATTAGEAPAQALVGAFATAVRGPLTIEAIALVDGDAGRIAEGPDAGARQRQRVTAGARIHGRLGRIGLDAEAYGQGGARAGADGQPRDDIRAWLASIQLSAEAGPLVLAVGATRLSGDADPADGVDRRFDTLFATNHKFYGAMDVFPRGTAGLDDLFASVTASPVAGWRLQATGHAFATAVDAGGGRALGTELDLDASRAVAAGARLGLGASVFRATDRLDIDATTAWSYLMASVAF